MTIADVERLVSRVKRFAPEPDDHRDEHGDELSFIQIADLPVRAPSWLIKDVLELDTVGFLYGDSETAKTLIGIDLAACVALQMPWHGHAIKAAGSVWYVLGEGHGGIARRRAAWEKHYGKSLKGAPLYISERPGDFFTREGILQFLRGVERLVASGVPPPVLVVIDTMSRNVGDGFEETTDGVRTLLNHVNEYLRARWRCTVLFHHHVGHVERDRMRGPRALVNNSDFAYRTERPEKGGPVLLVSDRMKDGNKLPDMAFNVVPVDLGLVDDDRQIVYGVTVESTEYSRAQPHCKGLGKAQGGMLALLRELYATARVNITTDGRDPGDALVGVDCWNDVGIRRRLVSGRQAFYRVKSTLLKRELITVAGKSVRPVDPEESAP